MFCSHTWDLNFTGEVIIKDINVIIEDWKILNTKDIEPIKELLLSWWHFLRAYSDDWERTEKWMIYNPWHKDKKEVKEEVKEDKEMLIKKPTNNNKSKRR